MVLSFQGVKQRRFSLLIRNVRISSFRKQLVHDQFLLANASCVKRVQVSSHKVQVNSSFPNHLTSFMFLIFVNEQDEQQSKSRLAIQDPSLDNSPHLSQKLITVPNVALQAKQPVFERWVLDNQLQQGVKAILYVLLNNGSVGITGSRRVE